MSLTPEQQAMRARSIGSTDSAAVMGLYRPELAHLSKMKNATDVWMRHATPKTSRYVPREQHLCPREE